MRDKKNIDRLFQEQFKDFEAQPRPEVWNAIAATQKREKEDRKIIPLWWKLGGVAAGLALLISLGLFLADQPDKETQIVDTTPREEIPSEDVVTSDQPTTENEAGSQNDFFSTKDNSSTSPIQQSEIAQEEENKTQSTKASPKENTSAIVASYREQDSRSIIATQSSQANTGSEIPETDGVAQENKGLNPDKTSAIVQNSETVVTNQNANAKDTQKAAQQSEALVTMQPQLTETEKPSLIEEALAQQELLSNDNKSDEQPSNKWSVGAAVAPVFYDSFKGSGIAREFDGNAKAGDLNLSVGLQLSYALNDRLKVRSGVHKVDLSYRTGGVAFAPSLQSNTLKTIDYAETAQNISIGSAALRPQAGADGGRSGLRPEGRVTPKAGFLTQNLGYFEIPMELEYAVINKKIGVQLIGGLSTLLLSDNEITLSDGVSSTLIGASNSLNDVSFTTNIGLGIDYEVSKKFKFNLEPMFKYQLNAYTNEVDGFKSYYLGVYSGINFKF